MEKFLLRYGAVLFIFIIALFLRTHHLESFPPGLYPDEAMNGSNTLEARETGNFKVYYPENNGREGLFINIQAFVLEILGVNAPWALRIPSALFGTLTVLGLYFLSRELFHKKAALLGSFFIATSVWHMIFSRIGFRAIMAPLLLTWALFFFLSSIRKSEESKKQSLLLASLGGIVFGAGFYTYIAFRITPLLFFLFIPFFKNTPNFWKLVGIFLFFTTITALPIGIYYLQNPADFFGRTAQISVFDAANPLGDLLKNTVKTLGMFHVMGDWNWRHNVAGRPLLFWPVGIAFLLGIGILVKNMRKKVWQTNDLFRVPPLFVVLLLGGWFGLTMLPVVISNEGLPHALRAILMIPPIFITAGIGAYAGYRYLKLKIARSWIQGAGVILLAFLLIESYQTYFYVWGKNPKTAESFNQSHVLLAETINQLPAGTPKYIIVRAGGVGVKMQNAWGPTQEIPVPAQTVIFLTESYTAKGQREKNIHYLPKDQESQVPTGALKFYID